MNRSCLFVVVQLNKLFSLHVEPAPHLLSPQLDHLYLPHYKSLIAVLDMRHVSCGINSLLHSVDFILFTILLVHLILRKSPHHSHHLRSHYLSLPQSFTPDLKLISFTN